MRYRTYLPTQDGNKFKRMETGSRSNAAAAVYALVKREYPRKSLCAFILSIHSPHQLSTGLTRHEALKTVGTVLRTDILAYGYRPGRQGC